MEEEERKMHMPRRLMRVLAVVAVILVLVSPFVLASDRFYDVPYGFAHDEINRIANRYITTGCSTPGAFCPNDLVARNQMAVFLDRSLYLAQAAPWQAYAAFSTTQVNPSYESAARAVAVFADAGREGIFSYGYGLGSTGIRAYTDQPSTTALFAQNAYGGSGYTALFTGPGTVRVSAATFEVVNGSKNFKMDHPLDPANKYLVHAAVESPEMKNVYDGVVTTDANGNATVTLPSYFEAVNGNYRYQLTTIGQQAQAWVATKIANNSFTIKTDKPIVEVSWQVTGARQDPWAKANPLVAEQPKPAEFRGTYLHPKGYGQPDDKDELVALEAIATQARVNAPPTNHDPSVPVITPTPRRPGTAPRAAPASSVVEPPGPSDTPVLLPTATPPGAPTATPRPQGTPRADPNAPVILPTATPFGAPTATPRPPSTPRADPNAPVITPTPRPVDSAAIEE